MEDIFFVDRATGEVKREEVYGEKFVKWAYQDGGTSLSRRLLFHNPLLSNLLGWYFGSGLSRRRIAPAIEQLAIDVEEFRDEASSFGSFNAFFTRHLKPEARPFDDDPETIASPADGRLLVYPNLRGDEAVPVKGRPFSVRQMLQRETPDFTGGVLYVVRLCPADYHRFHFPCGGQVIAQQAVAGALHSVNPIALQLDLDVFGENKREYCLLKTTDFGTVAFIEVGAFGVGSIVQTYADKNVAKMDEKGFFKFGGSTVILVFQQGMIEPDADLVANSAKGIETLVKCGETIARKANHG